MKSCRIKPARLSVLMEASNPDEPQSVTTRYQHHDSNHILNRMLRIAESPIVDYFFGMPKALRKLGKFYGMRSESVFAKSLGEVAYDIGFRCHDPLLSSMNALRKIGQSQDEPEHQGDLDGESPDTLDLSSQTRNAILDFLRPLSHTEHVCVGDEYAVPKEEWLKPTTEQARPKRPKLITLSSIKNPGDYFNLSAYSTRAQSPELRILRRFYFPYEKYFDAVQAIYGHRGMVADALNPFQDMEKDFLGLVAELENVCTDSTSYSFPDAEVEAAFGPFGEAPSALAYKALYNLYIRPFALIHIEHEPLKEHIEKVNSR